ncbi:MAG: hypothetical protein A2033_11410 [Bacteroidetes bacterium GWA2_31_9]|nr:MAG: hypothetical protein A2033_11410 [Bacteroidetes bacterium GWA2_31_9]
MAGTLFHYKIFIATPGGLIEERKAFRDVVENFNQSDAIERGFYFQPVGWEDTLGHQGRPQEIINEDLRKCDYMFLVLHDRWGSPSSADSKYSSGTEEEFHVALECINSDKYPMIRIALFFKDVAKNQLADPGTQLSRVLTFKKEREDKKDFLYETFDVKENFSNKIQFHLSRILRDLEKVSNKPEKSKIESKIQTTFQDNSYDWLVNITKYNSWDKAFEKAEEYLKQGKTIEAELIFSQITQRSNNPFLIARYGKYLRKQGRIQSAQDVLIRAEELSILLKDINSQGYCKRQLGRIEEYKGNMGKALELFRISYDLYQQNDNLSSIARTLRDIAFVENKLGRPEKAIESINESIGIYSKNNEFEEMAASLGYLGVIYKDIGQFEKAKESHQKALDIQKRLNNQDALARIYSNIAVIFRLERKYDEALEQHNRALDIFNRIGDTRGIAREYANIGVVLRRKGSFNEAIDKHTHALEIEEKVGNRRGMQIQFSNLGLNHLELNELDKAEYYFNKSLSISQTLDDHKGESHQYKNFGALFLKKGDYTNALIEIEKALKIDNATDNKFGVAGCYRLKAEIHIQQGKFEDALISLQNSRDLYKLLGLNDYVSEIENEIKTLPNKRS